MANGYIGKISALVTASTADLSRKLQGSSKDVDRFAKSVSSQIFAASRNAQNSLNSIFTPLQKLERALKAAGGQLNLLKPGQAAEIRSFVSAAEGINKPLEAAQRQFVGLSAEVAGRFIPALNRAQEAALQVNDQISRTGIVAANNFREAQRAVEAFTQSQARLSQIDRAAAGGRTGREAEFVSPRALQTLREAAALSERASQLSPAALQDGGVARQVQRLQTFRNAIARTVAEVEEIRLRPQVDTAALAAAERRLDNIVETTRQAQQELEQIVNGVGQSTDVRARLQSQFEVRRAVEEEAAFRQRAADAAERELAAVERLSQAQNRVLAAEIDRRSGAAARRNAAAFDAATEELLRPDDRPRREFGIAQRTRESELARAAALEQQFLALPESDRNALEQQRRGVQAFRDSVESGGTSVAVFTSALDNLEQGMADVEARAARIRNASGLLVIDEETTRRNDEINRNIDAQSPLGDRLAEQGRRRVRGLTGDVNIDSTPIFGPDGAGPVAQAQRDIDALGTRVGAVRQQLETLPNVVRTRFIPELQRAQAQLVRLQNSPVATVEAIENATRRVERLEAAARRASEAFNFRQSFGGAGLRGIEEGLNQQALRGYTAQLQLLQQTLAGTSQAARGPAVAAFDRLRNAIADAMDRGTLETAQTRQEIQRLTQDAVRATAAAAGIGERGLARRLQRVGDIGRGAFGNLGLGVQQAVFAIDDFFSVTGGLEQRIRAAGNNISQLGFILGGTAGLIAGVAVSVGSQLVLALIRYQNAGVEAQDRTKALNDALARQKSLVEGLAEAFRSFGDDLSRRVFSAPAQQAREFARELEQIAEKQRELNELRLADLDPDVQRARAVQNRIDRELPDESNPGRRIALIRERRQAERDEREAIRRAESAGVTDVSRVNLGRLSERQRRRLDLAGGREPPQNLQGLALAVQNIERLAAERALLGIPGRPAGTVRPADAIAAGSAAVQGVDASDALAVRALVRRQIEETSRIASGTGGFFGDRQVDLAREQLPALQRLLEQLEAPTRRALAALEVGILRASNAAAASIEAAQDDVAEAIQRGVRGAAGFQAALDGFAQQLTEANASIRDARQIENPEERAAAVRAAEERVRRVQLQQERIDNRARDIRLGRTFGGQRTTAALSALEGNERFSSEQAGLTARLRRAINEELEARQSLAIANRSGDPRAQAAARVNLEAAQAASDLAAAAGEAALSIESAFDRVRRAADGFVSASEGLADDAQKLLDGSGLADRGQRERERNAAEINLIRDRERGRALQAAIDRERAAAADDPRVQEIQQRLEAIRSDRENEAANARLLGLVGDPNAERARAFEEAALAAERELIIRERLTGVQRLIDEENRLAEARRRAAEQAQRQREFEVQLEDLRNPGAGAFRDADAVRGLGLIETPGGRAARELQQNLADIDRAVRAAGDAAIAAIQAAPNQEFADRARQELAAFEDLAADARARVIEERLRQAAPAIFNLADQVQNAVLQGPSRAALNATDVSTVEGSRELNRLLRGDDASRDQNLVELQRQSDILRDMLVELREGGAGVANQ